MKDADAAMTLLEKLPEKIQALNMTVFNHNSKHLEVRQKYSATCRIFSFSLALNVEHTTDFFLDQVNDLSPTIAHFFEESSVVKTTSRRYVTGMHHSENQCMKFRDTHQMLILLGNFWYFKKTGRWGEMIATGGSTVSKSYEVNVAEFWYLQNKDDVS